MVRHDAVLRCPIADGAGDTRLPRSPDPYGAGHVGRRCHCLGRRPLRCLDRDARGCRARDGNHARFAGAGVLRAVHDVETELADLRQGRSWSSLADVDAAMIAADGTANKARLGANAIVGRSMAPAGALAASAGHPLRAWLPGCGAPTRLPVPGFNVLNGGAACPQRAGLPGVHDHTAGSALDRGGGARRRRGLRDLPRPPQGSPSCRGGSRRSRHSGRSSCTARAATGPAWPRACCAEPVGAMSSTCSAATRPGRRRRAVSRTTSPSPTTSVQPRLEQRADGARPYRSGQCCLCDAGSPREGSWAVTPKRSPRASV